MQRKEKASEELSQRKEAIEKTKRVQREQRELRMKERRDYEGQLSVKTNEIVGLSEKIEGSAGNVRKAEKIILTGQALRE